MSFFTSYVEVKTSSPNDATNDIIHYCYTKNNFVSSRNMIEFNSPSSIRLNEAKAISLIYLQVVCNRGRKHRKSIKLKAEIQKMMSKCVFRKTCFISKHKFLSTIKVFYSKSSDFSELIC